MLTVQFFFFWQPQYNHKLDDRVDLLMKPTSSQGLKSIGIDYSLYSPGDDDQLRPIESGQIFKPTTKNPETHPLPSWELLEMQWFLQRVVAMSSAASWPRFDFQDNNDIDSNSMPAIEEISNYDWDHENVLNWIPELQENEQAWAYDGNSVRVS